MCVCEFVCEFVCVCSSVCVCVCVCVCVFAAVDPAGGAVVHQISPYLLLKFTVCPADVRLVSRMMFLISGFKNHIHISAVMRVCMSRNHCFCSELIISTFIMICTFSKEI